MEKEVLLYVGTLLIGFEIIERLSAYSKFIFLEPVGFLFAINSSALNFFLRKKNKLGISLLLVLVPGFLIMLIIANMIMLPFGFIAIIIVAITAILGKCNQQLKHMYKSMLRKNKSFYIDTPRGLTALSKWNYSVNMKSVKEIDAFLTNDSSLPFIALAGVICITASFILELT